MMRALKEYNEMVMRPSWKWLRRHWKGYSVLLVMRSPNKDSFFLRDIYISSIGRAPHTRGSYRFESYLLLLSLESATALLFLPKMKGENIWANLQWGCDDHPRQS